MVNSLRKFLGLEAQKHIVRVKWGYFTVFSIWNQVQQPEQPAPPHYEDAMKFPSYISLRTFTQKKTQENLVSIS